MYIFFKRFELNDLMEACDSVKSSQTRGDTSSQRPTEMDVSLHALVKQVWNSDDSDVNDDNDDDASAEDVQTELEEREYDEAFAFLTQRAPASNSVSDDDDVGDAGVNVLKRQSLNMTFREQMTLALLGGDGTEVTSEVDPSEDDRDSRFEHTSDAPQTTSCTVSDGEDAECFESSDLLPKLDMKTPDTVKALSDRNKSITPDLFDDSPEATPSPDVMCHDMLPDSNAEVSQEIPSYNDDASQSLLKRIHHKRTARSEEVEESPVIHSQLNHLLTASSLPLNVSKRSCKRSLEPDLVKQPKSFESPSKSRHLESVLSPLQAALTPSRLIRNSEDSFCSSPEILTQKNSRVTNDSSAQVSHKQPPVSASVLEELSNSFDVDAKTSDAESKNSSPPAIDLTLDEDDDVQEDDKKENEEVKDDPTYSTNEYTSKVLVSDKISCVTRCIAYSVIFSWFIAGVWDDFDDDVYSCNAFDYASTTLREQNTPNSNSASVRLLLHNYTELSGIIV